MTADATGTVRATIGRASDFYGPWGRQSTAGERLFEPALAGKVTRVLGRPDLQHTYTYLADFARGLVTLGTHDEAFGEVWHLPSAETISTRQFATLVYEAAGGELKLSATPAVLLAVLAMFDPTMRAVREQQYQREAAWVVDDSKFRSAFGADITPHAEAIEATLAWFTDVGQRPIETVDGALVPGAEGTR